MRLSPPVMLRLIIETGCTKTLFASRVETNNTRLVVLKLLNKGVTCKQCCFIVFSNFREIYSDC